METKYELEYVELLAEEEIEINKIPTPIRKKINALKMQYARYNNTTPTEKMRKMIIKNDLHICDEIQSFIEKDLPNKDEFIAKEEEKTKAIEKEQEEQKIAEEKKARAKEIEQQKQRIAESKERHRQRLETDPAYKQKVDTSKMCDILEEKFKDKEYISTSELRTIIGKEPGYPIQVIGTYKLKKVFLSPKYQLVS